MKEKLIEMHGFNQFELTPELQESIAALGFETPTPVQKAVIPLLLEGRRNLVALAQTGTGKTAAFAIPILQRINTTNNVIQVVVMCPTRELCLQVCRDLKSMSRHSKAVRSVAIYGGASIEVQIRALRNGVHIIVATPGRLHDLWRRKAINLSTTECVVLDEADEMLSMGFEEDLNAILAAIPDNVQKLLFSATMPRQVKRLSAAFLSDPLEITIGERNAGADTVIHEYYMIHEKDRYAALKRILDVNPLIYGLVFCRTRAETQDTAAKLIQDGYQADALHGDLSQIQRDRVMQSFRSHHLNILVATDVAARGLDIQDLSHVINYQLPDDLESYTHRSGRTGRAGKSGLSIVLINTRERWKIRLIERQTGKPFSLKPVPSGQAVCEARLMDWIDRVKAVKVNERQMNTFFPKISEMLDGFSHETLLKHFVSLELNRFLEYYREAENLNVIDDNRKAPERRPRSSAGTGNPRSQHRKTGRYPAAAKMASTPPPAGQRRQPAPKRNASVIIKTKNTTSETDRPKRKPLKSDANTPPWARNIPKKKK